MWQPGYLAKASLNFWLLVLTCAAASAADLAPATPPLPVPWVHESWTGFYVGVGGVKWTPELGPGIAEVKV
jgi:hypothetical protein